MKPEAVHRFSGIYFVAKENPGKVIASNNVRRIPQH